MTVHGGHTDWCAGGHHCGLGEHRANPITVVVPNSGTGLLTRVCDMHGRQYAEIRLRVALSGDESRARRCLIALLTRLPALISGARG